MSKNNWKEFTEQTILDATTYTGNKEKNKKIFSASMLSQDTLQNYYKFKFGSKDSTQFEANTFGSCFHTGVETIFNNLNSKLIETEKSLEYELDNGWTISGSIDLILHEFKMILDWKTTTATTIKNVYAEREKNGYALQLGVYRLLVLKCLGEDYFTSLGMIDKGHSYFKTNKNKHLEFIEVETYSPEEIEKMLYDKTNQLQQFIDLDQEPEECENLWIFRRSGHKPRRMKCLYYCDQADNCKYYNKERVVLDELLEL